MKNLINKIKSLFKPQEYWVVAFGGITSDIDLHIFTNKKSVDAFMESKLRNLGVDTTGMDSCEVYYQLTGLSSDRGFEVDYSKVTVKDSWEGK